MNFQDRENAIGTLLRDTILPRYKRPEHMDDTTARAEIADMVADLNAEWPIQPPDRFETTAREMARALRANYSGRNWPPIAVMLKSLKAAMAPPPVPREGVAASKLDIGEIRRAQLLRWCRGEAPCADFLITRENLEGLARAGEIDRAQIGDMLAYAAVNHGISEEAERARARGDLPPPLAAGGTHEEILARNEAIGARLRGNSISNPAFTRAAE